jgi:hypothetical protein
MPHLNLNFRSPCAFNIGTNPKIKDNDPRTRSGYVCLK